MGSESIVGLIIVIFTALTTYQGLTKSSYQERYMFSIDDILIHNDYVRMLSSGFLHSGWLHFGFNMIALMSFASVVESNLGKMILVIIYFASLLGGSLLALILHRNHGDYKALGASGAVSGVVAAVILMNPLGKVSFIIIPIEFTSWVFGLLYILVSILGIKSQGDNIGHEAHLGGTIAGLLLILIMDQTTAMFNWKYALILIVPIVLFFIIIWWRPDILLTGKWNLSSNHKTQLPLSSQRNIYSKTKDKVSRNTSEIKIDGILDKIKNQGLDSLSKRERKTLDDYSK